jgi:hypothetical protein
MIETELRPALPVTELRPALPVTSAYSGKDQLKWTRASCMIGRGSSRSSTQKYADALGEWANPGRYSADDWVFVSAEGARGGRLDPDWAELQLAVDAGASFVTDDLANRQRSDNLGERQVAAFLAGRGYREGGPGLWTKDG